MSDLIPTARRLLPYIDLTSLNENDTEDTITKLCHKALSPLGQVAAVCVYPRFVALAKQLLCDLGAADVRVATVVNFPAGTAENAEVAAEIEHVLMQGAHEIDAVLPFRALASGQRARASEFVRVCRQHCGTATLKVIIESGELKTPELIREASLVSIDEGADFIKTSTGKALINATPEAAKIMLEAIRASGATCGFKAAGGVRRVAEALPYLTLADTLLGSAWVNPAHFRLGASQLLTDIAQLLNTTYASKTDA